MYCELTSDLFFLKNSLPVESIHAFGNEYDVKPITLGSIILCWFNEMTTSSISLKIKCSCGLMWKVSGKIIFQIQYEFKTFGELKVYVNYSGYNSRLNK